MNKATKLHFKQENVTDSKRFVRGDIYSRIHEEMGTLWPRENILFLPGDVPAAEVNCIHEVFGESVSITAVDKRPEAVQAATDAGAYQSILATLGTPSGASFLRGREFTIANLDFCGIVQPSLIEAVKQVAKHTTKYCVVWATYARSVGSSNERDKRLPVEIDSRLGMLRSAVKLRLLRVYQYIGHYAPMFAAVFARDMYAKPWNPFFVPVVDAHLRPVVVAAADYMPKTSVSHIWATPEAQIDTWLAYEKALRKGRYT